MSYGPLNLALKYTFEPLVVCGILLKCYFLQRMPIFETSVVPREVKIVLCTRKKGHNEQKSLDPWITF